MEVIHSQKHWRVPRLEFPIKLDIGCGVKQMKKKEGFIGLDIEDLDQEILWDVDNGLPLPDKSVEKIFMHHSLEHVKKPLFVINECHRVLMEDGELEIIVPYYEEPEAYTLHHTRLYSEETFRHLTVGSLNKRYGIKPWKGVKITVGDKNWISDFGQRTVHAVLTAKKEVNHGQT